MEFDDEYFMNIALIEAKKALAIDEVPIGAIVVQNNKIISRGYNQTELLNDPTAHAEMLALTSAFNLLGSKYLFDATLYVTLEPCLMCCGALYWSKVGNIVFGGNDSKNGYQSIVGDKKGFHPKTKVKSGVLAEETTQLVIDFFKSKR